MEIKNLLDNLGIIEVELHNYSHIFLCLDYDGTLTPIKRHPDLALIPNDTKELLQKISDKSNSTVAIVTGRSYRDIFSKVKLEGIYYAANHGFELCGPGLNKKFIGDNRIIELKNICDELKNRLYLFRGVWIENKGTTASIHYRQANKEDFDGIKQTMNEVLINYEGYHIVEGKRVYEIRPSSEWNKGKAVMLLTEHLFGKSWNKKVCIIYVGDDQTDEDAFKLIKDFGIGIKVAGNAGNNTHAGYILKNIEEVTLFLKFIKKLP